MSSRTEAPSLLIIAGANGSGKSSAYQDTDVDSFGQSAWIINPDLLAARICRIEALSIEDANLAAVRRIEVWLDASIDAHQSVGVETVLSTPKYRRLVVKAKNLGFEIRLIYVLLRSVKLNVERVKLRVEKGGHAVPEDKIVTRRVKSLEQLPWFLDQADDAWIYDNSGASPRLIGAKHSKVLSLDDGAPPEFLRAVLGLQSDE